MAPKRPREDAAGEAPEQASRASPVPYPTVLRPCGYMPPTCLSCSCGGRFLPALQEVVKGPRKQLYRMRAHSNPLNDASFPVPLTPDQFDWCGTAALGLPPQPAPTGTQFAPATMRTSTCAFMISRTQMMHPCCAKQPPSMHCRTILCWRMR